MTNIRRYYTKGSVYFLTHVTHRRAPLLMDHVDLWRRAVENTLRASSCEIIAWVVMPDHIHLLVEPGEEDLSLLMRRVKLSFSAFYRRKIGVQGGRVWQNRFWDHVIRNENDMNRHIDYIHYNPVKHGFVDDPFEWRGSSIHVYLEQGYYHRDWGVSGEMNFDGEFGE